MTYKVVFYNNKYIFDFSDFCYHKRLERHIPAKVGYFCVFTEKRNCLLFSWFIKIFFGSTRIIGLQTDNGSGVGAVGSGVVGVSRDLLNVDT